MALQKCVAVARRKLPPSPPKKIEKVEIIFVCMFRATQQTKWKLIRARQEQVKSYKEVCAPVLERCRSVFLTQQNCFFFIPEHSSIFEQRGIFEVPKLDEILAI